jgi:ABC-2 type transport system permease protein
MFLLVYFFPEGYGAKLPSSFYCRCVPVVIDGLLSVTWLCCLEPDIDFNSLGRLLEKEPGDIIPALVMIFSGVTVPLVIFPDWAQSILQQCHFAGLMDIPMRFYLGITSSLPG